MPATDLLKLRALALDAPGLEEALDALDDEECAEARAWVLSDEAFFSTLREREPHTSETRVGSQRAVARFSTPSNFVRTRCQVACPSSPA